MTRILTLLVPFLLLPGLAHTDPPKHPNIILIYTDDHGYADLGAYGNDPDVRTPNLDLLMAEGAVLPHGYVTAPQCIPSRAGFVVGRHQNGFDLEDNNGGPLPLEEYTIAERLRDAGYATGMVGKWHLEIAWKREDGKMRHYLSREHLPDRHGFEDMFMGYLQHYHANYGLDGADLPEDLKVLQLPHYRVDIQTKAALAFLDRREDDERPFFLFFCPYAPHSPMEDPPQYMERMAHVEEYERRMGLSSILAIDGGVGLIREKLEAMGETENTLIFFIGDNGAPIRQGAYVGSMNTPLTGEKGMQTDGGQRVPFLAAWPGTIPAGTVVDEPVWSLDASATALAAAGVAPDERIEGVNLLPWLTGQRSGPVHDALFWRWRSQAAVLAGNWKFIRLGSDTRYLFDVSKPGRETADDNLIADHPAIAERLERMLEAQAAQWTPPGLPESIHPADQLFFDIHVEGVGPKLEYGAGRTGRYIPWDPERPTPDLREWCANFLP